MAVGFISSKDLYERMSCGEPVYLLDVRAMDAFLTWRIEAGANVETVNVPYSEAWGEEERNYRALPKDREIIVNCNRGRTAQIIADILDEKGYQVTVLEKGMQGWSQFYHAATVAEQDGLKLIQINRLGKGCLSYMIISHGQAMVIDAGRHIEEYEELAKQEGAAILHVADTHLHADHISGGRHLAETVHAAYYISAADAQEAPFAYRALEEQQEIAFGTVSVQVVPMQTPGHTPGSVSFLVNGRYLLSGDTIFVGGLGRPDLGGKAREWAQALYETVFQIVAGLEDEVLVLPAHFSGKGEINERGFVGANLGEIRATNEAMRTQDREHFVEMVAGRASATPPNYQDIVQINKGVLAVDQEKATELETGPNRCAVKHQG